MKAKFAGGAEGRRAGKALRPPGNEIADERIVEDTMCEHSGCHCQQVLIERNGKKFCSETCAQVQTTGKHGGHCPCGHPSCGVS
jgi:hypothetical protein